MTIATAANVVAITLRTVAPFPEAIIIITMTVIIFAELDIRISALAINNAEQPISVSRFETHFPTVFKCKCKSVDLSAFGWYAPPVTPAELLYLIINIPRVEALCTTALGLEIAPPTGRALKNYRYFHFIGVFRRHYRAFTRRSGYDVW